MELSGGSHQRDLLGTMFTGIRRWETPGKSHHLLRKIFKYRDCRILVSNRGRFVSTLGLSRSFRKGCRSGIWRHLRGLQTGRGGTDAPPPPA